MIQDPFPCNDSDPFNTTKITEAEEPTTSSSWQQQQQTPSPLAPRWQLLTDQEKKDQSNIIQKLESKLKKLNKDKENPKSNQYYTNKIILDESHQFESFDDSSSDGEQEEGNDDRPPAAEEEENEGLPLLWKNRNMDLDHAPKKTEDQYDNNKFWWPRSWFPCC